jgi:FtsH-binding integral membrane protein
MAESKSGHDGRMSPNWGLVAAGVLLPVLTKVVARWLPLPYASAITSFVVFYAAYWLFSGTPRRTRRGIAERLAIAGTAGVIAGLLGFWFPW